MEEVQIEILCHIENVLAKNKYHIFTVKKISAEMDIPASVIKQSIIELIEDGYIKIMSRNKKRINIKKISANIHVYISI